MEASIYGLRELRQGTTPRAYVHKVRNLARAIGLESIQLQLTTAWNHMHVDLRQHIPEPTLSTTLSQFYEQIDAKAGIWKELSTRQRVWDPGPGQLPQRSFPPPPQQQQQRPYNQQRDYTSAPFRGDPRGYQRRIPLSDGKAHAFLVDVTPDGHGLYEEEDTHDQFYERAPGYTESG